MEISGVLSANNKTNLLTTEQIASKNLTPTSSLSFKTFFSYFDLRNASFLFARIEDLRWLSCQTSGPSIE